MVDAHCHLYESTSIEEDLQKFRASNGTALICCGGGLESSKQAVKLASQFAEVFATVGVHPEETLEPDETELLKLAHSIKVVAIGEAGLDYYPDTTESEKVRQHALLKINLKLAKQLHLPLVMHCRNAFDDLFRLLDYDQVQMHCFTGNQAQMEECVRRGWYISFGGIITFKKSEELREVAKLVPENRLLIETDSPYLAPEPIRGSVNTPANVKIIAENLAGVRNTSIEAIDKITSENAKRLFKLTI